MTTTKKQRKKTKLQVSDVWSTPPTDAQKSAQPGEYVVINNGTFKGTSVKVITNLDRRGYIVEVTNGKQYIYHPEEIIPTS